MIISQSRHRHFHGVDNAEIPGASAEIAAEFKLDALPVGMRNARHHIVSGNKHTRGAKPALHTMTLDKTVAYHGTDAVVPNAFNGLDHTSVGCNCQHQARTYGRAIDKDRASAADAVLAPEMRAREELIVSQKIGQRGSRLHYRDNLATVNGKRNVLHD
jgi:hypothetical protein